MAIKQIPLYTCLLNGQPTDTVSARDLYTFLQLDHDFFHWVKTSRSKLYFVKERDFILVDNLIRPTSDVNASVQKTKDYFISLDMAYEMAMEEEGDLAQQASDYLRSCDTPQQAYIAIQDRPFVRRAVGQAMKATTTISLPIEAQVKKADLDQYQALGKATQPMAPDEDLLVLPIHEVSKTIETLSLYRDKVTELHGLSVWMEQHINNLHAYINHQLMDG